MKAKISVLSTIPPSPRKWKSSRRSGLILLLLMVVGVLILNLETIFPFYYQSGNGRSDHLELQRDFPTASYLIALEQRHRDRAPSTTNPYDDDRQQQRRQRLLPGRLGAMGNEVFLCDRSHTRSDVCYLKGDVRMDSRSASFVLLARNSTTRIGEERIKPYTRKWEKACMDIVHEVRARAIPARDLEMGDRIAKNEAGIQGEIAAEKRIEKELGGDGIPTSSRGEEFEGGSIDKEEEDLHCDVHHSVPAVVFTTGGYTGNVYHEFHDGLIPLFITSQHLAREVVFVGVELHEWWLTKYADVISQLSAYDVIDFDRDRRVHCFPEVTIGLHIHDELAIDPALMPGNRSIAHFRAHLDAAYQDEQSLALAPSAIDLELDQPRLTIIARNDSRVILNLDEVVAMARKIGFWVDILRPDRTTELRKIYRALNSSDVMLGVHGAAMTHFLFMRPGSIFIQVVPLGTKWAAAAYYGDPARKLGLNYLGYEIGPDESSLIDKYPRNDTVLTDPAAISTRGWAAVKEIYLEGQNVRLSLPRFETTLREARRKALDFRRRSSWPR